MLFSWLLVAFLLGNSSASDCDSLIRKDQEQLVKVGPDDKRTVHSIGFPSCCRSGRWKLDSITGENVHWKMLFTDLDLPPGSKICIEGTELHSVTGTPHVKTIINIGGMQNMKHWHRPTISYHGVAITVYFVSSVTLAVPYSGFRAEYWMDIESDEWKDGKPITDCPQLVDPMFGGEIRLDSQSIAAKDAPGNSYLDCRWQMKAIDSNTLQNYVRITALDFPETGAITIYQGISSPDTSGEMDEQNIVFSGHSLINEDVFVFVLSHKGFYIEMKKPISEGRIVFQYGTGQWLSENEECQFSIGKNLISGFRCNGSARSLCIPRDGICDSVPNCPDGEDEAEELCKDKKKEKTFEFVASSSKVTEKYKFVPKHCTKEYLCPNGVGCRRTFWRCGFTPEQFAEFYTETAGSCSTGFMKCPLTSFCVKFQVQCPEYLTCPNDKVVCSNGMCISKYFDVCPKFNSAKPCGNFHKICEDGRCVTLTDRCPEDPCPEWKPYKCDEGETCYASSDHCNGFSVCLDLEDENLSCKVHESDKTGEKVTAPRKGEIHWWIWGIVALAAIFIVISIASCIVSWRRSTPPTTVCEAQGYSGIPMQSASDEPQSSSPNLQDKRDHISGDATLGGLDTYEIVNSGKTYGTGYQEGCMQFY